MRAVSSRAQVAAVVTLCSALWVTGCESVDLSEGPPESSARRPDEGAARAKVSACTGQAVVAAFTFFWPSHLGGVGQSAEPCVMNAQSCAEVLACAGYENPGCTPTERCDAGTRVSCRAFGKSGISAELHESCASDLSGNVACSTAPDSKQPDGGVSAFCHGASCTNAHCEGDVAVTCFAGFERRYDCGLEGKSCSEDEGQPTCVLPNACEQDSCAADVVERCRDGRVVLRESCSELLPGTTCLLPDGQVNCHAPIAAPDCEGGVELSAWCEGALAVVCWAGLRIEADCGVLPEGACESIGGDAEPGVRCTAGAAFASIPL